MKKYRSQSTEIPTEWDITSSQKAVYHNRDIVVTPATEDNPIMYDYNVTEYTKEEYNSITIEQNRADIAYIGIMTGVL